MVEASNKGEAFKGEVETGVRILVTNVARQATGRVLAQMQEDPSEKTTDCTTLQLLVCT